MKIVYVLLISLLMSCPYKINAQSTESDLDILLGHWKLDLSPEDHQDNNFAKMIISSVAENSIEGEFYRNGVKIREGRLKLSGGIIYVALVSNDNSGTYNTSFYFKDGLLHGTTHALDRDFLAVWKGQKLNE